MVAAARVSLKKLPSSWFGGLDHSAPNVHWRTIVHEQNSVFHQSKDSKLAQSLEQDTGLE